MEKYRILLVEDSEDIVEIVSLHLVNAGFQVMAVSDYSKALQVVKEHKFDLIILDILLPDSTGYELCKKVRESIFCPIIFMSCLDSEDNITKALELGGDDYITKPARPKEIVARVKANLRRVKLYEKLQSNIGCIIELGDVTVDASKHTIEAFGRSIYLTPLEFNILMYLVNRKSQLVSYSELFENVWKTEAFDDHRTVKVHVSNLKNKLKLINDKQNIIVNIRSEGYILKL